METPYDLYSPAGVEDLIKRLKASVGSAESYEECRVYAANIHAAVMVLEKHLAAIKKGQP
ncbi:hypothetical protein [Cupriavidus alkaliphilus]|uniref:Uncharacterized protein n=1 Tax=Cupriavidus alkaliphilus TaxID=942866 RepID=A0A7W4VGN8_9BURK|nr:hypothetical protein [Cupriavidus alkaliphilus]MBB3010615.1 hypothetical protein [Cupriavidus alkaliphilus]